MRARSSVSSSEAAVSEYGLRTDLALISEWIEPHARVLDLGCGDGTLLKHLRDTKLATGYGLEIAPQNIVECISKGLNVIQTDLNEGLSDFDDGSFDYVIITQSLQAMHFPDRLLAEVLRIGREGIVSFPNMGHWKCRVQFGLRGRMPLTRALPNAWYSTPNIHLCTLKDFERLCEQRGFAILKRAAVDNVHRTSIGSQFLPNLLGESALYRLRKRDF